VLLAWHDIYSIYDFWPSNDLRGSGSIRVRPKYLDDVVDEATKVNAARTVAA
jgi:hypothetical protein